MIQEFQCQQDKKLKDYKLGIFCRNVQPKYSDCRPAPFLRDNLNYYYEEISLNSGGLAFPQACMEKPASVLPRDAVIFFF